MSDTQETSSQETTQRFGGRVKWFNNKAGFGFITACDGDRTGEDVFVHHTGINVEGEHYKYLVQGEYVEFTWSEMTEGDHKWQAVDVRGVRGQSLMCETRAATRAERAERTQQQPRAQQQQQSRPPRSNYRGGGPRGRNFQRQGQGNRFQGARDNQEEMRFLLRRIEQIQLGQH